MADISKITLPDNTTYNIKDNNARNFTNTPYYEQDEEALMFQLGESYMTGEQNNQPYSFRAAGGSADIGNREYDKIVGGTVAWNQLVQNGNFDSTSKWIPNLGNITVANNELTYTVRTISINYYGNQVIQRNFNIPANHIILLHAETFAPYTNGFYMSVRTNSVGQSGVGITNVALTANMWSSFSKVAKTTEMVTDIGFYWSMHTVYQVGDSVKLRNVFMIDLTQMFGTTIADYIYSLEQATAGAGVAWFRKLFPKPYYEYNPGELMSVQAVAHKLVGFNAWDEEWELGIINTTTGEETDSNSNIRSKNYIRVIPGATYYFKLGTTDISNNIVFYDAEKNYVAASSEHVNDVFTVPEDAHYMKFYMSTNYGRTYLSNICINLSGNGERDGEYEEYNMHSYPLDSSLVLRGIPKLDANNQLYYDGDTYEADGTVTRKYGIVDLGTLNPYKLADGVFAYHILTSMKGGILCNRYVTAWTHPVPGALPDKNITTTNAIGSYYPVAVRDNSFTDAATFKAAMSGVMLVYELKTPTTEAAEPYDNPQIVDPEGTEEYITTNIVFVGHETKY